MSCQIEIDKVRVIKDCTNYNFCNILKGVHDDPKWLSNRIHLQRNTDTILGIYLNNIHIRDNISTPGYNPGILKMSIQQYISMHKPSLPKDDETCLYFRLGDQNLTEFDYISPLMRCNDDITVVCCIVFSGTDKDEWSYNEECVRKCKKKLSAIMTELKTRFENRKVKIISNNNPDLDICYLFRNGFISHPKCSWKQIFGNF